MELALRALRQWKLRAEGAVEASGQILREWDTSADESLYSGAMESILGILPHEIAGRFEIWVSLIHPDDRAPYRKEIQRVLMEGGPFQTEYRVRMKSGKYTLLLERGYFITPAQGSSPVLTSVISDVSDLRDMESRLRQSQRVEAFSQLTGGVAHDFNNMLSVVIGYTQILIEEIDESSEQRLFLGEIEKAAFRASSLTNQLLAFSKPPSVRKATLHLNELLNEVCKMLKRLLGEQIELVIKPEPSLWTVQADRSQIEQVFINLAVAAREEMPLGGQLTITSTNRVLTEALQTPDQPLPAGRYVCISLAHSPESACRASKGYENNRNISAASSMIEKNEGRMVVDNCGETSLCLDLYLPSAQEKASKPATPLPERVSKKAVILLVEDDSAMRQFAKTVLQRVGHCVIEAADGEEALQLFTKADPFPDLVLTDMVMPRMGGIELAQRIKNLAPATSVLLISGYSEQQALAAQSGPSFAFLKKPFAVGELISKVGSLL
jgi:PAS domain S-box-containing protein